MIDGSDFLRKFLLALGCGISFNRFFDVFDKKWDFNKMVLDIREFLSKMI